MPNNMRLCYFVGLVGILTDTGRGKMMVAINSTPQVTVADIRDNVALTDGNKAVGSNMVFTYGRKVSITHVQQQRSHPIAINDENDFWKPPSEPWG